MEKLEMEIVVLTDKFDKNIKQAEQSVKKLKNNTKSDRELELSVNLAKAKIELENLKIMIKEARRKWDDAIEIQLQAKAERLKLDINEVNRALRNLRNTGDETKSMLGQIFENSWTLGFLKKFIGPAAIGGAIGGLFNFGQEAQRTELAFQQMTGSMEKGTKLYKEMQEFAKDTPFGDGVLQAAKLMMAMGYEAKNILPTMKSVGEAVSAMGGSDAELMSVARALGQIKAKGKLSAEEVNQLAERWIGVWKILSEEMKRPIGELQKMAEKWQLLADDVLPLILQSFDKNYGGMMNKMSDTAQGRLDELLATLKITIQELWKIFAPIFSIILKWLLNVLQFFQSGSGKVVLFTTAMSGLTLAFGLFKAGIIGASFGLGTFGGVTASVTGGVIALKWALMALMTTPIGWILMLATAVGSVGMAIYENIKASEKQKETLNNNSKSIVEKIKDEEEAQRKLNEEQDKMNSEEFQKKMDESKEKIIALRAELDKLTNAQEIYNASSKKIASLWKNNDIDGLKEQKIIISAEIEVNKEKLEEAKKRLESGKKYIEEYHKADIESLKEEEKLLAMIKKMFGENSEDYKRELEIFEEKNKKIQEIIDNKITQNEKEIAGLEKNIELHEKLSKETDNLIKKVGEKSNAHKNLEMQIVNLETAQKKLDDEYASGKITLEEYIEKTEEGNKKIKELRVTLDEYKKGLKMVQDEQMSYKDKIEAMNKLKINPALFNDLLEQLKKVKQEALNTARSVALAMQTKLKEDREKVKNNPDYGKWVFSNEYKRNVLGQKYPWERTKFNPEQQNFNAMQKFLHWEKALQYWFSKELDKKIDDFRRQEDEIHKIFKEIDDAKKEAPKTTKSGKWGGGGKSQAQKEAEKAKKEEEKREKELWQVRTQAYEKGQKQADKYQEIIISTNKKLAEQKKKMQELKKEAIDTIKDIDEKLLDEKKSFTEKLASRYKEILEEIKEQIGSNERGSIFSGMSDENIRKKIDDGSIQITEKLKKEIDLIKKAMSEEELKLALKKEERSETEKITEEYQKQKELGENLKKMHEAKRDGRFITNENGEMKFYDENGNFLEGKNREQEKEFSAEAKKIQNVADEELKINAEKIEKIAELEMEFQKEREKINKTYFNEDKEMRIRQNTISEEFFKQEIARMAKIRTEAITTTQALSRLRAMGGNTTSIINNNYSTTNNATNTQNVSVKSVADVRTIDRQLGTKLGLHNFRK